MAASSQYSEIDPEFQAVKSACDEATIAFWKLSLAEMKEASFQDLPLPETAPKVPEDVQVEDIQIPTRDGYKMEVRVYRSQSTPNDAMLNISYHGGGWTTGKHTYDELTNRYVASTGRAVVVSPLYRLAPEHAFPYPFDDCVDTLTWAVQHGATELGCDSKRIILSGSSAGGNLTAAVALYARDQKIPGIVAQVLNIPATCHPDLHPPGFGRTSLEECENATILNTAQLYWFWRQYIGSDPTSDTRHSPLLAKDLSDLPPALVQIAGLDPLRDDGVRYGELLKAAGNKVRMETFKGVPHGFGCLLDIAASRTYHENVVSFIRAIEDGSFSGVS